MEWILMKLWLDDIRDPTNPYLMSSELWKFAATIDWTWAKTADEAVAYLRTGQVEFASLDHDLTQDQMRRGGFLGQVHEDGFKSGYDVVCWLEQHPEFWPLKGVRVHSANPAGAARMRQVINRHYRGEI